MAKSAKQTKPKKWVGTWPNNCTICRTDLTKGSYFVHGRIDTPKTGSWGLVCESCHYGNGIGIGPGRGQVYDAKTLHDMTKFAKAGKLRGDLS